MPISVINGIRIYSEWHGEGAPVALVHGSWGDHHNTWLKVRRVDTFSTSNPDHAADLKCGHCRAAQIDESEGEAISRCLACGNHG